MNVKLNGKLLEEVDCFKYFGSQVASDGGCGREKCVRGQCSQRRCVLLLVSGGLREESECARDEEFEKKKFGVARMDRVRNKEVHRRAGIIC